MVQNPLRLAFAPRDRAGLHEDHVGVQASDLFNAVRKAPLQSLHFAQTVAQHFAGDLDPDFHPVQAGFPGQHNLVVRKTGLGLEQRGLDLRGKTLRRG